jgi:predicted metal-binding protein
MTGVKQLETIARNRGLNDFKWIDPKTIIVAQWVRIKCEYGCQYYGRIASCPPNTPTVEECRQFFGEYRTGMVFHFQKVMADTQKRRAWGAKVNAGLAKVERDVFIAGYPKAFMLFMGACRLCAECVGTRAECNKPRLSRPTPEAMAVDVFATVRRLGYPIEVLADRSDQMNRYAFLMVE